MTGSKFKQLNPFELKSALTNLLSKINSVQDIQNCLADFEMLDSQTDKSFISKLLFKELVNSDVKKIPIICFLLEHYTPKDELITKLWETLKNQNLQSEIKITVLNLLRELGSDWSYETCEEYLGDSSDILDESTKQLLNTAIINPEVPIDFMDFVASLKVQDKITLLNSFGDDFSDDALANILIPVFESEPNSPSGIEALKILGNTKSQLALHILEDMERCAKGELYQSIRKSLSTLKLSGIREDNTKDFYKKILSDSKPHKFYTTYPDGHGDMAMIFTRLTKDERIRFVSVVINTDTGIRDCFGFFYISKFECDKILERFLRDEKTVDITPDAFKKILKEQIMPQKQHSEIITKLEEMKVSSHWFLNCGYSDEFDELIKDLKTENDLDMLITKYQDKIFYEEEKSSWTNKLVISAYIKYAIGKENDSSAIYGLSQDENLKNELFKNILRRSIYEYLTAIKYDKNLNTDNFSPEEIDTKIKYIEEKWVQNV